MHSSAAGFGGGGRWEGGDCGGEQEDLSLFVVRRFHWVTTTCPDLSVGSSGVKIRSDGVCLEVERRDLPAAGRQCSQSPLGG